YDGQPEFEFIKKCPAGWDEIKVLNGVPGEYISIARRKENDWYVGSITNWQPRKLSVPLTFLKNGKYTAEIYEDGADAGVNPKHTTIFKKQVDNKTVLQLVLAAGGGYAVWLTPSK
ncbi:MAG: glycoside hydrolase family 97 C-terminal domain-containing protein, partial [Bacteroidota bacterium]